MGTLPDRIAFAPIDLNNAPAEPTAAIPHPTDDPLEALVLDLVAWIAEQPRAYGDVLDAWRTSCPRLPVWEEAVDRGYVRRVAAVPGGAVIHVTQAGRAFLARHSRLPR